MRRLIIDTDTASDDAVAIMMAIAAKDVSVDALTIVAGNVSLRQASTNARFTLEMCRADVPVYEGCDRPWLQEPSTAHWYHGNDGMGDMNYSPPVKGVEKDHAVAALIKRFCDAPGEIDLVTLGPLTNIATALSMEPDLAQWVNHCYVMGGSAATLGNVTPAAEYNIWCDPDAAKRVFQSGMSITMLGWELSCDEAALDQAEQRIITSLNTRCAQIAMDCNRSALDASRDLQGQTGMALADPVAMAVALYPQVASKTCRCFVDVETTSELTRGMTVVDKNNVLDAQANATVCLEINASVWKQKLLASLSALP